MVTQIGQQRFSRWPTVLLPGMLLTGSHTHFNIPALHTANYWLCRSTLDQQCMNSRPGLSVDLYSSCGKLCTKWTRHSTEMVKTCTILIVAQGAFCIQLCKCMYHWACKKRICFVIMLVVAAEFL